MARESRPRTVVLTGASRGIGAHLAGAFTGAGDIVIGCSRTGDADTRRVDVTDADAVAALVADVLAEHGRIDVLINNAGLIDDGVALQASDPQQWWRTVEVNVRGPYLLTREVLPSMLAAGSGRVINLNSGAGTRAAEVSTAYNVSKSALGRLTGSTHLSGAGHGVFAFDLAPGVVRTDMTRSMDAHADRTQWTSPQDVCDLALALAHGRLDAWSGRMVRAGADTIGALRARAAAGLADEHRTVALLGYGPDDPVA